MTFLRQLWHFERKPWELLPQLRTPVNEREALPVHQVERRGRVNRADIGRRHPVRRHSVARPVVRVAGLRQDLHGLHHPVILVHQDVAVIHPHAGVIREARPEHYAPAAWNRHGIHPHGLIEHVMETPLIVRHLDAGDPERVDVHVERVIGAFRGDLELRIAGEAGLPFGLADGISLIVKRVLPGCLNFSLLVWLQSGIEQL